MSIDASDNTNLCDQSTQICVEATQLGAHFVLAQKRKRWHRSGMGQKKTAIPDDLSLIAGAQLTAALLLRQKNKLNATQYAKTIHTTQQNVSRVLRDEGGSKTGGVKFKMIRDLTPELLALGLKKQLRTLGLQLQNVSGMTEPRQEAPQIGQDVRGAYDLPLFKARWTEGGVMAIAATADHHTKRPEYLSENGKSYAVEMVGDSMSPKYEDGDTLYVDPKVKPEIGKSCVLLKADRRIIKICTLVGMTAEAWRVQHLKPPAEPAELLITEWPFCEAIEGVHSPHRR
jgi:phage repressor protein C with HTH and peptisase S24 domain